ncbi:polyprenyl synthetase [Streptomyces venezuelae]|uniref:Polyprenyl synthetase n=1 Tax=Streptomyces venezuelae TaxID=54571 RepID=A0A5P2CVJ5_STRVZ|nr:polyprenyl synthetase family protein [Streptomyces venezuelae]QES44889.1 polyprenyl synthetase [Streptomyces venezuelae]
MSLHGTNPTSLSTALARVAGHRQRFEAAFAQYFADLSDSLERPPLSRFAPRCLDLLAQLSLRGGKRLRVALLYEAARLVTEDEVPGLAQTALSLELLQSHSIILDDIIDDAPVKRGGPSTLYACREDLPDRPQSALGMAMMVGELAGFLSLRVLLEADLPAALKQAMLQVQLEASTDTVFGQVLDLERDLLPDPGQELLDSVSDFKTARYTVLAPLRLGLLAAGADPSAHEPSLRRYAALAGIGGQIRDDYFDLFGDPRFTGKPLGVDVRAGRHTYVTRALLAATSGSAHAAVRAALRSPDADPQTFERLRTIALDHKVDVHLQETIERYGTAAAAEAASWRAHWREDAVAVFEQIPQLNAERTG